MKLLSKRILFDRTFNIKKRYNDKNKINNDKAVKNEQKNCLEKLNEIISLKDLNEDLLKCFYQIVENRIYEEYINDKKDNEELDLNEKLVSDNKNKEFTIDYIALDTFSYINSTFNLKEAKKFYKLFSNNPFETKISQIAFNNFKAFGEKMQKFSKKPITLVYAPNSVGKSSFQHTLLHLHYFIKFHFEKEIISLNKTDLFGDEIDLGGFENYVHKHDTDREINYYIEINDYRKAYLKGLGYSNTDIIVENFFIQIIKNFDNGKVQQFLLFSKIIFEYELKNKIQEINFNYIKNIISKKVNFSKNSEESEKSEESEYIAFLMLKLAILYAIIQQNNDYLKNLKQFIENNYIKNREHFLDKKDVLIKYKIYKNGHSASYDIKNFKILKFNSKNLFIENNDIKLAKAFDNIVISKPIQYIGPLRYYPERNFILNEIREEENNVLDSKQLWSLLLKRKRVRDDLNSWLTNKDKLKSHYKINVQDKSKILFLDKRTDTLVSHKDIGLGVSQVLPVLVASYFDRDRTVIIEQPELHLHPAVQAELGDEIIKSYKQWNNDFFLETHSEYLLLRIMRRMRYKAENKGDRDKDLDINPNDICLLYIDADDTKTYILELELSDEGKLLDRWPGGFFEEGFKERFL